MDGLLTAALGAAPQLGVATALVFVLGLLVKREVQTTERHATEMARMAAQHEAEERSLRVELDELRERRLALEQALDEERARRRAAEDGGPGRHRGSS